MVSVVDGGLWGSSVRGSGGGGQGGEVSGVDRSPVTSGGDGSGAKT